MADAVAHPPLTAGATDYPVMLDLDAPLEVARWRPLVHWILVIPHAFVVGALQFLSGVMTFIAFFSILFTKKYPKGMFSVTVMAYRYQWRVSSYMMFMRETYPPFEFDTVLADPGTDPAKYSVQYPTEMNRFLPLVKFFLAIPHLFVFGLLSLGGMFVWIGAFFAVLFTGRYPESMRDYLVGVTRYGYRLQAYVTFLTDRYPPFTTR